MNTIVTVDEANNSIFIDNNQGVKIRRASNSFGYKIINNKSISWQYEGNDFTSCLITEVILNGEQLTPENADQKLCEALFI